MTFDNGSEFAMHTLLRERGIDTFFTDPYNAGQRGSVENYNGIIRRFLPKKTDFNTISDDDVFDIQSTINSMPMKLHGWHSRAVIHFRLKRAL